MITVAEIHGVTFHFIRTHSERGALTMTGENNMIRSLLIEIEIAATHHSIDHRQTVFFIIQFQVHTNRFRKTLEYLNFFGLNR